MANLISTFNPLLGEGLQLIPNNKGAGTKVLYDDGQFKAPTSAGYSYKGAIAVNTDFPLLASVASGDWYNVTAIVTDNAGVTYTNTGKTFQIGDEIYWDGTTWQNYGSVIKSTSEYECTVGSIGADYTTLGLAIAAGKSRILVISNTTETSNITLGTFHYYIKGQSRANTITFNACSILQGTLLSILIDNIGITVTGAASNFFSNAGGNSLSSVIRNCYLNISSNVYFFNLSTEYCYIQVATNTTFALSSNIHNCYVNGASSTSNIALGSYLTENVIVSGTFNQITLPSISTGIYATAASVAQFYSSIGGVLLISNSNLSTSGVSDLNMNAIIHLSNSTIKTAQNMQPRSKWDNVTVTGTSVLTLYGVNLSITNSSFAGGIIIYSNFTKLANCLIGTTSGGGKTITINAGVTKTTVIGCTTESTDPLIPVTDNGTSTELGFNTTF